MGSTLAGHPFKTYKSAEEATGADVNKAQAEFVSGQVDELSGNGSQALGGQWRRLMLGTVTGPGVVSRVAVKTSAGWFDPLPEDWMTVVPCEGTNRESEVHEVRTTGGLLALRYTTQTTETPEADGTPPIQSPAQDQTLVCATSGPHLRCHTFTQRRPKGQSTPSPDPVHIDAMGHMRVGSH